MKHLTLLNLIVILGVTFFIVSCDKENDNGNAQTGSRRLVATIFQNDSTAYIYDSKGRLSELKYYTGDYNSNYRLVYTYKNAHRYFYYNNDGLLNARRYDFNVSGGDRTELDSFFYDPQKRIEKMLKYYYLNGQLTGEPDTTTFQYDENNRIFKIILNKYIWKLFVYNNKGNIVNRYDYSYNECDSITYSFDDKINPEKNCPMNFFSYDFFNTNNVINYTSSSTGYLKHEFKYDKYGYPISRIYYLGFNSYVTRYFYK